MLVKHARKKRYPQNNFAKNAVEVKNIEAKISKLKTQSNYSIYQTFNEKIAEFQKTIW